MNHINDLAQLNSFSQNKKTEPLVSVIITCYNHEKYVEEAIRSVWTQTYKNIEIIIADDGSTDSSPQIIKDLIKISPLPIQTLIKENEGLCRTLNKCLNLANGEYISVFAADDRFLPEKITVLLNAILNSEKEVLVCYAKMYQIDSKGVRIGVNITHHISGKDLFIEALFNRFSIPFLAALVSKKVYNEIGNYDESLFYEDFDFLLRLLKKVRPLYLDVFVAEYRVGLSNNMMKQIDKISKATTVIIDKHFPDYIQHSKLPERKAFKKLYSHLYCFQGNLYLGLNDKVRARKFSLKSIRLNLIQRKAYYLFLKTLCSAKMLLILRALKNKLFKLKP